MNIKEAEKTLKLMRGSMKSVLTMYSNVEDVILEKKNIQAVEYALGMMKKYQKIEQIIKDIPYGGDVTVRRIQEVVEDGECKS